MSVHDAGALTFAARLGKQCTAKGRDGGVWTDPEDMFSSQLEAAAASLAALAEAQGLAREWPETVVDVRVGIAWTDPVRLRSYPGRPRDKPEGDDSGLPISQYRPVSASWVLDDSGTVARDSVVDLALDLVNQAG